jgi:hypothetical protein
MDISIKVSNIRDVCESIEDACTRIMQNALTQSTMTDFATFEQAINICRNPHCRAAIHISPFAALADAPHACIICGTPYHSDRGDAQV